MAILPSIHIDGAAENRDGFRFRSGWPSLDLTATLIGRLKPKQTDLLAAPGDLDRWMIASGLAGASPNSSAEDLEEARLLRESIYAIAIHYIHKDAVPPKARKLLNDMAGRDAAVPELAANGTMRWKGAAPGLLTVIAREAVGLFGTGVGERIRQCEAKPCAILFVDFSRSGDRRWCSMASCGNKAKVAEYRRRKRAASTNSSA